MPQWLAEDMGKLPKIVFIFASVVWSIKLQNPAEVQNRGHLAAQSQQGACAAGNQLQHLSREVHAHACKTSDDQSRMRRLSAYCHRIMLPSSSSGGAPVIWRQSCRLTQARLVMCATAARPTSVRLVQPCQRHQASLRHC